MSQAQSSPVSLTRLRQATAAGIHACGKNKPASGLVEHGGEQAHLELEGEQATCLAAIEEIVGKRGTGSLPVGRNHGRRAARAPP